MTEQEMNRLDQNDEQEVHQGVHNFTIESKWIKPDNPVLLERLEWFKDQKLGFMIHWGPYSQLGIEASWPLSDEDADWSRELIDWEKDSEAFKRQYFGLNQTFNPIRFQPEVWAELAKEGGFKYVIFTTKHHDGFCMWDTRTTDYRITGTDTPFHTHQYADICKYVFNAFREKDLGITAYFSKADWHTPYYWAPGMERSRSTWRGPSYDPEQYPSLWEEFVQFTHKQIDEITTQYGRIDVLWLDAGWVRPSCQGQDIRLGEAIERARRNQPWLLSADRTVGGNYENFVTPEQEIPEEPMDIPWESCITLGTSWSFNYDDHINFKSTRQLVHILLEVVAKGGNLAINVGPGPDGRLPMEVISRVKELGVWMKTYGEAVYGTRICSPYYTGNCAFTKKDESVYCSYLYKTADTLVTDSVSIPYRGPASSIELVGTYEKLAYSHTDEGLSIRLPESVIAREAPIAHVFRILTA